MDYAAYIDHLRAQTAAMRAAAEKAGPAALVPTCPGWTAADLVGHVGGLQAWVRDGLRTAPDGPPPPRAQPPADWAELLDWWTGHAARFAEELAALDPATRAWTFVPNLDATAWWYARRSAHEVAIHRLDAEHAAQADVPTLLYDTDFAADGIDEMLTLIAGAPAQTEGTVLLHAADAGRAWLVAFTPGEPPRIDTGAAALDADASIVGTADAVYRAVWGRPSHAVVTGDRALIAALQSP